MTDEIKELRRQHRELYDLERDTKEALLRYVRHGEGHLQVDVAMPLIVHYRDVWREHKRVNKELLDIQIACKHVWKQVAGSVIQCSECGSSRGD